MIKQGPRIRLLPFEPQHHSSMIYDMFHSGEYDEYFREVSDPMTFDMAMRYGDICNGQLFSIFKGTDLIGFVVLYDLKVRRRSIKAGIILDKGFQNQGFCLEAMYLICDYLFTELSIRKVVVEVLGTNDRLKKLLPEGGFEKEATLVEEAFLHGEFLDLDRYYLMRDKFLKKTEEFKEVIWAQK